MRVVRRDIEKKRPSRVSSFCIVDALDGVRKRKASFEEVDYVALGDYTGQGEEYFARDAQDGRRMASVHVMTKDTPDVLSQIILRDYLQCHSLEAEEYSEVKRRAYDNGKTDRSEYPKKKKEFLLGLIERFLHSKRRKKMCEHARHSVFYDAMNKRALDKTPDIPHSPRCMVKTTDLLKGTTPALILAALSKEDLYGYRVIQLIRETSEEVFSLGEGSVYPVLHALEKKGLVKSRWEVQEVGPARKYYALTAKGRRELEGAAKIWRSYSSAVEGVLGFAGV